MSFMFSPSCSCCEEVAECECCSGAQPHHIRITISGVTGSDTCCSNLNAEIELDPVGTCHWEANIAAGLFCVCGGFSDFSLNIDADIIDSGDGNCDLTVTVQIIDAGDSDISVELVFHLEAASPVDCCGWDDTPMILVSFTNNGDCDCGEDGLAMTVTADCS